MVELTNDFLLVEVAPEIGGKIVRFVDRKSGYDFLWRNGALTLKPLSPGSIYDPNFFGGIDELLPNDQPEKIVGVMCPDHGELWTAEFRSHQADASTLVMEAYLPLIKFDIMRQVHLKGHNCEIQTRITNRGTQPRPFMWKLHPALAIEPGDQILCNAESYTIVDPNRTRRSADGPWSGETVPEFDGTVECLVLHNLVDGSMTWRRGGKSFEVIFDKSVFPYAWYFASYGGLNGYRLAILEPCTSKRMSVNEADEEGTCSVLVPGASMETTYTYRGVVDED